MMLLGVALLVLGCEGTSTAPDTKAKVPDAKVAETKVPDTSSPATESKATEPTKPVEDPFVKKGPAADAVAPPTPEKKTDTKM
jgi:hypothetical protein